MSNRWIPGRVISGDTFKKKDYEIARLKLAIVKRNFKFIDFYGTFSNNPYSIITEFRLPDEPQDIYMNRIGVLNLKGGPFFGGRAAEFGFFERFITTAQEYWGVSTSEIMELLHPGRDLDELHPLIAKGLPLLFYSPGIEEFGLAHGLVKYEEELCYRRYKPEISENIERYERLLKIDLRKNPAQLMEEFKALLGHEKEYLIAGQKYEPIMEEVLGIDKGGNFNRLFDWDIDDTRERKESWKHLRVWDLRRKMETIVKGKSTFTKRKTFGKISTELRITEDLAKKRFYRAHEITQGRKYDKEKKDELKATYKVELERECGTCEIRDTCNIPCPDAIRFGDQDRIAPVFTNPSDNWEVAADKKAMEEYLQKTFAQPLDPEVDPDLDPEEM